MFDDAKLYLSLQQILNNNPLLHAQLRFDSKYYSSGKLWSSQLWMEFKQLGIEAWKVRTSTGFEPVTSRFRCDALTNWAMKPLSFFLSLTFSGFCMHYCLNCVNNCDDPSLLDFKSTVQHMKYFIYHFTILFMLLSNFVLSFTCQVSIQ